jgi:hypothetical protein
MARPYYSRRKKPGSLSLELLYVKLQNLYFKFRDGDYFLELAHIDKNNLPKSVLYDAALALDFQPFPLHQWAWDDLTEEHIFDMIEFLFDRVSKPLDYGVRLTDNNEEYFAYGAYDQEAGREEFRSYVNLILGDYKAGYELTTDGLILALGADGLQQILNADIVPFDEVHVDSKVRSAIQKWRNRDLSLEAKKDAIRELADVFEWLKKTKNLSAVLDNKDESALFDLANNFAIRHHNPKQKSSYDPVVWYSWMFHFYLATYHAAIHLLKRRETKKKAKV